MCRFAAADPFTSLAGFFFREYVRRLDRVVVLRRRTGRLRFAAGRLRVVARLRRVGEAPAPCTSICAAIVWLANVGKKIIAIRTP